MGGFASTSVVRPGQNGLCIARKLDRNYVRSVPKLIGLGSVIPSMCLPSRNRSVLDLAFNIS